MFETTRSNGFKEHTFISTGGNWKGITYDVYDNVNIIEIDLARRGRAGTPDTIICNLCTSSSKTGFVR